MKSPLVLLSSLLQGCTRLEPCVKGIDRDLVTIESRFKHEGYGFLTVALPALCDAVDLGLSTGKFTCPPGFKQVRGGTIPRLFSGMFCEVFDTITGDLLENPNLGVVKTMREVLRCFKKLKLNVEKEETLDRIAKQKFFNVEEICQSSFQLDDRMLTILKCVTENILPQIESIDPRELLPKHGPGSVAEPVTPNQKWNEVVKSLTSLVDYGFSFFLDRASSSHKQVYDSPISSRARLITVPKDSTSRRTITIEPCCKQFIQQGLNTVLRDHIKRDPVLRWCLTLNDQRKNQELALIGSLTDVWATIDLSSASDLLTNKLVRTVFEGKCSFLEYLFDSRSSIVTDGNTARELEKYAGMGNATTFPVQSVVFAVLAICAILDSENKSLSSGSVVRAAKRVRVYGDDIIVPSEHARKVVSWLTASGLKVNAKKSFLSGRFKESCGVDAFMGVDVTPMYVRHLPANISKRDPSVIAHYVELSNHAWMRGHYEFANLCQSYVEEVLGTPLPLTRKDSGGLGLHCRLDSYSFQKWDKYLHKPLLRAWTLLPKYRKDCLEGYGALLKFFLSTEQAKEETLYDPWPAMDRDPKHLERTPVRFRNRIVQRWVAA